MIHPPASQRTGIVLLVLGLAGVAINSPFRTLGFGLGLPLIVVAAGVLGKPGTFVRQLRPFVGKTVRMAAWSHSLPGADGTLFHVDAIESLGFGLWIRLSAVASGPSIKLKIAQPTSLVQTALSAEIGFAGYVQWNSRRIKGPNGQRAPGVVVMTMAQ